MLTKYRCGDLKSDASKLPRWTDKPPGEMLDKLNDGVSQQAETEAVPRRRCSVSVSGLGMHNAAQEPLQQWRVPLHAKLGSTTCAQAGGRFIV